MLNFTTGEKKTTCDYDDGNLSCNCVILSSNQGDKYTSVLFSQELHKAFLVLDSCRATERSGNSVNADVKDAIVLDF